MDRRAFIAVALFTAGIVAFWVAAIPSLHHFDDFAYLYAARHYSMHDLLHGAFESSNVPGFYNPKAGHLVVLKCLIAVFGDGMGALRAIEVIYTVIVILSALVLALTLRTLLAASTTLSFLSAALMLIVPVTVYLAAKLLAEGPAMAWATASLWLVALALRRTGTARGMLCLLAAGCLAFSIYTRIQFVLCPAAMFAAVFLFPPSGLERPAVFRVVLITGVLTLGLVAAIDYLGDAQLMRGLMTATVVANQHTAFRARVDKVMEAFGLFLIVPPLSLLWYRRRDVQFLLAWLVLATAPFLIAFDFLETRWMLVGAPALAALAAICVQELLPKLARWPRPVAATAQLAIPLLAVAAVTWSANHLQRSTEFGLDEDSLVRSKNWVDATYPGRPILVPWTHSDYHYLSFAYPHDAIYAVNSESFYSPATFIKEPADWPAAMEHWYGSRYAGNMSALQAIDRGPWLAIAWQRSEGGWSGFSTSWIARDPQLSHRIVHRDGPYQVYLVQAAGATAP